MSRNTIVIDIETTGPDPAANRVCSLALIAVVEGRVHPDGQLYLIFDPGERSDEESLARHGLDDWLLRHQRSFADYAAEVRQMLVQAPLVVGHQLAVKLRFINNELERAGLEPVTPRGFCTREAAKRRWPSQSPGLDDCLKRLGFNREGRKHGASEDCALTAALYLFFQGNMKPDIRYPVRPQNRREPPPAPDPVPPRPQAAVA